MILASQGYGCGGPDSITRHLRQRLDSAMPKNSLYIHPRCIQVKGTGTHHGCPLAFCLIAAPEPVSFLDDPPLRRALSLMAMMMAAMMPVTALFEYEDVLG